MAQEMTHAAAAAAAGLVGLISIANSSGRLRWAWLYDFVGRRQVFLTMFLLQAVVLVRLSRAHSLGVLAVLAFVVPLCYGGGFGTMPALAADLFGPGNVGSIYGLMLTAGGFAGVAGPTLIAYIRQTTGDYTRDLVLIAGVMLLGAVSPLMVRALKGHTETLLPAPPPPYAFGRKP
jgi:OFA family oxalate/formate antiporter-like MFS transporter